jgi:oligopeptide transport system substrate-binding protein
MRSKRTIYLMLGVMLVASLLASNFSFVGAQDAKILRYSRSVGGDMNTIDPSLSEVADEIQVIEQLFVGLAAQDENTGALTPGIATSWEVSEDGLTYTFHLMEGLTWVHYNADTDAVEQVMDDSGNPRPVTAHDIVYAWQRTLDPATASVYAFLPAGYIVGGSEYLGGTGSFEDVGVSAPDDYTIQITQAEPVGFAPYIYSLWMVRPLPQWAIEEGGDEWTEPDASWHRVQQPDCRGGETS